MAVDLSRLPEEVPVPEARPSLLVWSMVFIVLVLSGSASALWLWPRQATSPTAWFWISVVLLPLCLAGALVLRHFARIEGQKNQALAMNTAVRAFRNAVFKVASTPLAVLSSAYIVDVDEADNALHVIRQPAVKRTRQSLHSRERIQARVLDPLAAALTVDDRARQKATLSWVLKSLLASVADKLKTIPPSIPVTIQLDIRSVLDQSDLQEVWRQLPSSVRSPRFVGDPVFAPTGGLWLVDAWLDRAASDVRDVVSMLVSVCLSEVREADPQPGSCEAASILLACPEDLALRLGLSIDGWLHRPQQCNGMSMELALGYALKWGRVEAQAIGGVISAGLQQETASQLSIGLHKAGRSERNAASADVVLDTMVGDAGLAAPWLAGTLALAEAKQSGRPCIVATQDEQRTLLAVLAPFAHEQQEGR